MRRLAFASWTPRSHHEGRTKKLTLVAVFQLRCRVPQTAKTAQAIGRAATEALRRLNFLTRRMPSASSSRRTLVMDLNPCSINQLKAAIQYLPFRSPSASQGGVGRKRFTNSSTTTRTLGVRCRVCGQSAWIGNPCVANPGNTLTSRPSLS